MASAAEGERLRSALLSSVSHDLRTPLASILGSVTSLRQLGDRIPKADQAELLATIEEEATRLTQFVTNLLDMTRLDAGALDIRRDWIDVADIIRGAVNRSRKLMPARKIELTLADGLPLIRGDATLLEQVMFNLIDNADKYSPEASVTAISAAVQNSGRSQSACRTTAGGSLRTHWSGSSTSSIVSVGVTDESPAPDWVSPLQPASSGQWAGTFQLAALSKTAEERRFRSCCLRPWKSCQHRLPDERAHPHRR